MSWSRELEAEILEEFGQWWLDDAIPDELHVVRKSAAPTQPCVQCGAAIETPAGTPGRTPTRCPICAAQRKKAQQKAWKAAR